jgi:acyl-homoserine lactone acylase PvdQ
MERLRAALTLSTQGRLSSVEDSARLQRDVLAWNADRLVPLYARLRAERADVEQARRRLLEWNRQIAVDSSDATTYVTWERLVRRMPGTSAAREPARRVRHAANNMLARREEPHDSGSTGDVPTARRPLIPQRAHCSR